tara:strand:+ start:5774 stop:5968 length:195 start_codon:yes stop_codon:yes gene_type:complete
MKTITKELLEEKIKLHTLWLGNKEVGQILNLSGFNLSDANLSDTTLSGTDLRGTKIMDCIGNSK